MKAFVCADCGKEFTVPPPVLARYPNWTPRQCLECRGEPSRSVASKASPTPQETLGRFQEGPQTGIFTDGSCEPNPGPGGWGVVKVTDGRVVAELHGHEEQTTNNRMELRALIEGFKMLHEKETLPVYSDSDLCVKTINEWAPGWERNGWRRGKKREPVMNLDLVKELYALAKSRPLASLQWVRGHANVHWNDYADELSRAYKSQVT